MIECVPNFSEGRNQETIDTIADAIHRTTGCRLLDVDPGASTNRTVYTFVGDPCTVIEGALAAPGTGLGAMSAKLTYGVRKFEDLDTRIRATIPTLHRVSRTLIPMIDADTNAFNEYCACLKRLMSRKRPVKRKCRRA
ncbi:MAG: hypothetical protein CSA26_04615 [Desulfobacterales bacterium]|nr:MAG: hypothetical protein CSA26_04615 [Desulfobacterales bacterium]